MATHNEKKPTPKGGNRIGYKEVYLVADILLVVIFTLFVRYKVQDAWIPAVCMLPVTLLVVVGAAMYKRLPKNQKVKPKFSLFGGLLRVHPYVETGVIVFSN